ncbi:hypothetical protein IQ251_09580 [Saccharopolyspora sp. HNM0983]|uniref:Uncharacterized protein n=1 Tax=Saccharopolyspora montiporae TaxID=2781240 RepID=A0A929BBX0_9PSEU|nr:hypothetical protein [Saccharopolyspora sp. HNM0983]MBE9374697.1 hypothetical protein [Saccharopolyspora sp. HNM0983]
MDGSRRGRPHPLIKPAVRVTGTGLAGLVLAAGAAAGAGTASAESASAAEPVVVDSALAVVDAQPGQQVVLDPAVMDFKVRQAVLLAMPLAFGPADEATEQFRELDPIPLGTAEEGSNFYSGADIADAAESELAAIGLPEDKVEDVSSHFRNLVSIGNGVTVRAEVPEEDEETGQPAPPEQPPANEQPPPAEPSNPAPPPEQPGSAQPGAPTAPQRSAPVTAVDPDASPAALSVLPPELRDLPASELPWEQGRFGRLPQESPQGGTPPPSAEQQQHSAAQQQTREQRAEVEAAGEARPVAAESSTDRIAAPVLLGAVSLALVTAALVRSWVLRRS